MSPYICKVILIEVKTVKEKEFRHRKKINGGNQMQSTGEECHPNAIDKFTFFQLR